MLKKNIINVPLNESLLKGATTIIGFDIKRDKKSTTDKNEVSENNSANPKNLNPEVIFYYANPPVTLPNNALKKSSSASGKLQELENYFNKRDENKDEFPSFEKYLPYTPDPKEDNLKDILGECNFEQYSSLYFNK
jgi:hypothetical protein